MDHKKTIVKNTAILFISDIFCQVISFFLIIIIAKYLGDVGLGKYSFAYALVGIFVIFANMGLNTLMVKEISRDKTKTSKYLNNIITLKLVLSIIVLAIPTGSMILLGRPVEIIAIVFLASLAIIIEAYSGIFRALFMAYEKMGLKSVVVIVERVIAVGVGIFILIKGYSIVVLMSVFVLSQSVSLIMAYFITTKHFMKMKFEFDIPFWKELLKKSVPFWMTVLFLTLYFRIDTVMLSFMKGYSVVGWYNASYKLIDAISFLPSVIIMAIFPAMSKFHSINKGALKMLYKKTFYYLSVLAIPLGIGTLLIADRIIFFIYGAGFVNSITGLRILIWAEVFLFVNYLMGYLLNSVDKAKLFTYSAGTCAIVNIILNLILIPKFSYIGAAIATVATEGIHFMILRHFTSKNGYKLNLIKMIYKPVIAGIVMGFVVYYFRYVHLMILIPLSAIVYFLVLVLEKGFGKEEIEIFKSFLPKKS